MEAVTNHTFRMICKKWGCDIVITEFIASDALIRNIEQSTRKMLFKEEERPLGIQIFGSDEKTLVSAALVAQERNPDFIDINWGCPVKKVAQKGAGSGILNDIPKMISLTSAVVKHTKLPITVKTRLGYSENNKPIVEIAKQLQDVGISALSIHGRTKQQCYKGNADWTLIGQVKNDPYIKIPIFGNGDISSPQMALEYKNRYNVDGILIGRAAIGNPFIFKQTKQLLNNEEISPITMEQRVETCKEHLDGLISFCGEKRGILEMRKNYGGYFRNIPDFKSYRIRLVTLNDYDQIINTLNEVLERF
jgi:nifR3 family TIM-barrel protein